MRVLVLDFDGVISDSGPEVFVGALRTFAALRPGSRIAGRPECREPRPSVDPEALLEDPLYREFVAIMPLGNRAEDFGVALDAIESGTLPADQEAYDSHYRALERREPGFLADFHRRFYEQRASFRDADLASWTRLSRPYPALIALLRRRRADASLAIATAKDRASVRALLRSYGIGDLFPEEWVLDKETAVQKRVHLEALHERLGVPFAELTFVDDKVNHLDGVRDLGVRCALAAWGYNGEREREAAAARGYLVCGLDDVEGKLFGEPRGSA